VKRPNKKCFVREYGTSISDLAIVVDDMIINTTVIINNTRNVFERIAKKNTHTRSYNKIFGQ
jgi:hypothetical protein